MVLKSTTKRRRSATTKSPSTPDGSPTILQFRIFLKDVSPMVWRRVQVPSTMTLREFHGVLQVVMGWESIHLYQFVIRTVRYGSWESAANSPKVALDDLKLRKGSRFLYEYDLNIPWEHEISCNYSCIPDLSCESPVVLIGDLRQRTSRICVKGKKSQHNTFISGSAHLLPSPKKSSFVNTKPIGLLLSGRM